MTKKEAIDTLKSLLENIQDIEGTFKEVEEAIEALINMNTMKFSDGSITLTSSGELPAFANLLSKKVDFLEAKLKQFDGAVEIHYVTNETEYKDENGNKFQYPQDFFKYFVKIHSRYGLAKFKQIGTSKTHTLYAIPKSEEG